MDAVFLLLGVVGSLLCYLLTPLLACGGRDDTFGARFWSSRRVMAAAATATLVCLGMGAGAGGRIFAGAAPSPGLAMIGFVLQVVAGVALVVGPARLLLLIALEAATGRIIDALLLPGRRSLRTPSDCAAARAAEARDDLAAAEALYRDALTGDPKRDDAVQLSLGNLYRRQDRDREAAAAWAAALEGDLPPEQHLVTALRLAELLRDRLDDRAGARAVLAAAVARHPAAPEAERLRRRLAANAPHGDAPPDAGTE